MLLWIIHPTKLEQMTKIFKYSKNISKVAFVSTTKKFVLSTFDQDVLCGLQILPSSLFRQSLKSK